MITADDLRELGYTVDDTTAPGTWTVQGFNRTWVFPADDQVTIRTLYEIALFAENADLRTRANVALVRLRNALASWDTLTNAEFKEAMRDCSRLVVHTTRLTLQRED